MSTRRTNKGFSLVELLVVITIIAFLLTIVVASLQKLGQSQMKGESMSRLRTLATALKSYREDYGDVPVYNATFADFNEDGNSGSANEPHGPGLWALVMLDYLGSYRFLNDPAATVERPWVSNQAGDSRLEVIPGNMRSMEDLYTEWYGAIANPGGDLLPHEEWLCYNLLARVGDHNAPATLSTDFGTYEDYDVLGNENYCSWMMQDPYTGEWKYLPVRRTVPRDDGSGGIQPEDTTYDLNAGIVPFPVDDASDVTSTTFQTYYHRQLSHRWSDFDSVLYLPAGDTVVTWSNLFRTLLRRSAYGSAAWGQDLILFADGHVEVLPGPDADVETDPLAGRAVQRPLPR